MNAIHPSRWFRHLRVAGATLAAGLFVGVHSSTAGAIGLGPIAAQSALGERLRIVVPILVGPGEELTGECVRLVASPSSRDGIPDITSARVVLERTAQGARAVVTTPRPISDPVVRLTLQAGCDSTIRREYTLLLDPLPIDIPVAATEPAPATTPAPRVLTTPIVPPPAIAGGTGSTTGDGGRTVPAAPKARPAPTRRAAAASGSGAAAAAAGGPADSTEARKERPAARRPSGGTAPPAAPAAPAAPASQPRLTVSAGAPVPDARLPDKGGGEAKATTEAKPVGDKGGSTVAARPGTAVGAAGAAADPGAALEAEAAALQARVVELTALVDKMQAEMKSADTRPDPQAAARLAAEKAARDSPQAVVSRWWGENWMLLGAVVAIAALLAVLLLRRRKPVPAARPWSPAPAPTMTDFAPASPAPAPATTPARPGDAQPRKPAAPSAESRPEPERSPATVTRNVAPDSAPPRPGVKVDVAELSHITEEAGVYLAVNRPDRAIDVLLEHIRTRANSLPAAWLMLLELYHAQGRKEEFQELAVEFHGRFNAQTPAWESFRQRPRDDRGLESFAHLVRQLVMLWGRPECIDFLDQLLTENREGRREGFSLPTYEDILLLHQVAELTIGGAQAARSEAAAGAPAARR